MQNQIVKHISNIHKTDELEKTSNCSILEQVTKDAKKRESKWKIYQII